MADRHANILSADRKYRISMELSSNALRDALLREYPKIVTQQEKTGDQVNV